MLLALHDGRPLEPHDLAAAWHFDGAIVLPLCIIAVLYAVGVQRLWSRAGPGSGVTHTQAAAFCAGWTLLVIALVSPLHALGGVLFAAHMAQHELMIALAAPLAVIGRPLVPMLWAMPIAWRRALGNTAHRTLVQRGWRVLAAPLAAWALHGIALWVWHLPSLYSASLGNESVHALQHASFLGTALLFWWALMHSRERRMGYGVAIFYVFTTALHSGALGALLTFTRTPLYPAYGDAAAAWGLSPLEDQQLAGLIMWIPAGLAYLGAGLLLFAAWLGEAERRVARWQGFGAG